MSFHLEQIQGYVFFHACNKKEKKEIRLTAKVYISQEKGHFPNEVGKII